MLTKLAIFVLLLLLLSRIESGNLKRVNLNGKGDFIDEKGRLMMFHGYNSVKKSPPYYNENIFNETQLALLQARGFNLVRLGVIWSAGHMGPGKFDEEYIGKIRRAVELLDKYGMYVILDMHQDGLSSRYGTYDAMPNWLIDRFPKVPWIFSFPWPLRTKPSGDYWFKSYLTYECQSSFQNLYDNVENALDLWKEFWVKLAETFKDHESVLGYELMNEPFSGNIFTNPLRLLPGYAGKHNLLPAYDRLVDGIRKVDKESMIFYEPVTWGVFWPTTSVLGTGFSRLPGSDLELAANKSVLSYHYYCWLLQTANPKKDLTDLQKSICDKYLMKHVFRAAQESTEETGGARMLTEFGLCEPDGNEKSINTIECNQIMRMADEQFQSWTYWDSKFFDGQGLIKETPMKSFSRCYPVKLLGSHNRLDFDVNNGTCVYTFTVGKVTEKDLPILEMFLPTKTHYPNSYDVTVEPDTFTLLKESEIFIKLMPKEETYHEVEPVTIKISPKA